MSWRGLDLFFVSYGAWFLVVLVVALKLVGGDS